MTRTRLIENPGSSEAPPRIRRFGVFELDLHSRELRKNGVAVHLQPQPFNLLAMLTARPGEVVTRQEMRDELWPRGTFVDFEQSLNFCIRQIRLALDDSAQSPRFVETLPRRGYRWIGGAGDDRPSRPGSAASSPDTRDPGERSSLPVQTGGGQPGGRWRWIATVSALASLVLLSVYMLRSQGPGAAHFERLTFRSGFLTAARFGADGRVVYSASWDGHPVALFESRPSSRDARPLGQPAFRLAGVLASGDVAFIQEGTLARAPLAGGPPRRVASGVRVADWVPSASTFALARGVAEGGYQIEYPPGRAIKRVPTVGGLRVSPGGRHLALSRHPMIADDRGFVTIIDRDGETLATSKTFGSLDGLAWSPGGDEVWFTAAGVGAQNSLRALDLQGRERILLESMGSLVLHDVASDGRLLVSRANQRAEILFQKAGTPGLVDLSWLDVSAVAALSPDGERILFYEGGEAGGSDYSTFLRSTSGSTPVHLGDGRALDLSPDGQWALVIAVTRPDRLVLLPTGAGTARELRGPEGMVVHDAAGWLPDGETLFVTGRDADHRRTTWLIDGNGRPLRQLPVRDWRYLTRNTFSLDGRRFVAGCPVPDRRPCLYEVDGGDPRPVPGAEARWEAIGWDEEGRLFFRDRPGVGHPTTLYRVDPAAGRAEVLARLAPPDLTGVLSTYRAFVTPDASAWAFTVIRRQSDLFIATGVR